MAKTLIQKLLIKPGQKVLLVNPPEVYQALLEPLPEDVSLSRTARGRFEVVHLFVGSKADIDSGFPKAARAYKHGGVLWVSYPKKSSGVATDISRDHGWETPAKLGWRPVSQVSINEIWSALRFRPENEVGT